MRRLLAAFLAALVLVTSIAPKAEAVEPAGSIAVIGTLSEAIAGAGGAAAILPYLLIPALGAAGIYVWTQTDVPDQAAATVLKYFNKYAAFKNQSSEAIAKSIFAATEYTEAGNIRIAKGGAGYLTEFMRFLLHMASASAIAGEGVVGFDSISVSGGLQLGSYSFYHMAANTTYQIFSVEPPGNNGSDGWSYIQSVKPSVDFDFLPVLRSGFVYFLSLSSDSRLTYNYYAPNSKSHFSQTSNLEDFGRHGSYRVYLSRAVCSEANASLLPFPVRDYNTLINHLEAGEQTSINAITDDTLFVDDVYNPDTPDWVTEEGWGKDDSLWLNGDMVIDQMAAQAASDLGVSISDYLQGLTAGVLNKAREKVGVIPIPQAIEVVDQKTGERTGEVVIDKPATVPAEKVKVHDTPSSTTKDDVQTLKPSAPSLAADAIAAVMSFNLKELFPFCIPFDLLEFIKLFDVPPLAPVIEVDLGYQRYEVHALVRLDFNEYAKYARFLRQVELLSWIFFLMMVTQRFMF